MGAGSFSTGLLWVIAILCCALPFLLIAGGVTIFAGVLFQQIAILVFGLVLVVLIALIYVGRKEENRS